MVAIAVATSAGNAIFPRLSAHCKTTIAASETVPLAVAAATVVVFVFKGTSN